MVSKIAMSFLALRLPARGEEAGAGQADANCYAPRQDETLR